MALSLITVRCRRASQAFARAACIVAALAFMAVFSLPQTRADTLMIDVANAARLDPDQMAATLSKADVILIGEHHDAPSHHLIQASLIEVLVKAGRRPVLLFEMLAERQEERYRLYRQSIRTGSSHENRQELDSVLEWTARGWPILPAYLPLFALAEAHDLEVGHADLPSDLAQNIPRYGVVAIPKSLRNRLFGVSSVSDLQTVADRLAPVVAMAHGMKSGDPAVGGLIAAQLAKDAYMALRVSNLSQPVVLLAGMDHVRTDIGVPIHLSRQGFKGMVLSIGIVDETREWLDSDANDRPRDGAMPPFDWVWVDKLAKRE